MNTLSKTTSQQYLPVKIGHQRFLIPLANVLEVHRRTVQGTQEDIQPEEPKAETVGTLLKAVDLGKLFWDVQVEIGSGHILTLSSSNRVCALVVNSIYPVMIFSQSQRRPLPPLISHLPHPFDGIFYNNLETFLLIDPRYLIDLFSKLSPELVLEPDYVT